MIKNSFLQQNSFDPKDMHCSPRKQILLLKIIVEFHDEAKRLLSAGVDLKSITSLNAASELIRFKSEIDNSETDKIERYQQEMKSQFNSLLEERSGELQIAGGRPGRRS
jgi:V/A-type H+/Na+-transporting ATPase subunit A